MKIERITQFSKGSGNQLYLGCSVTYTAKQEPTFRDVSSGTNNEARGWDKKRWLDLCTKFRLEFTYVV